MYVNKNECVYRQRAVTVIGYVGGHAHPCRRRVSPGFRTGPIWSTAPYSYNNDKKAVVFRAYFSVQLLAYVIKLTKRNVYLPSLMMKLPNHLYVFLTAPMSVSAILVTRCASKTML
jgi:hypothetical protein